MASIFSVPVRYKKQIGNEWFTFRDILSTRKYNLVESSKSSRQFYLSRFKTI